MRVYTRKIREQMWAMGMPTHDARFANIYRAAIKAGLTDGQAFALTKDAYYAANGYEWQLANGSRLHVQTMKAEAARFPNGKCAEELRAQAEGRPSRWGMPEFHRI
jgi:hypothetical protein